MEFLGYERPDGSIGTRNHVAVISTVMCANEVANKIASQVEGAVALTHKMGCGQYSLAHLSPLTGLGKNPNVAAVLVVGLGCEAISAQDLADKIGESDKPVESLVIQETGGTIKATEQGVRIVQNMVQEASTQKREPFDLSNLILGLECGGSDTTSGIAANPAVGKTADMIVEAGGTAILGETLELVGAEHVLAERAVNEEVAERIIQVIREMEERAAKHTFPFPVPLITPGNIEGGLSTLEEKSLGDIHKAGSSPIQGVLEYAQKPDKEGLFVMDEFGYDPESVTGMVAAGAQVITFTTGKGTPLGSPIAPVIKITGNPQTYEKMKDNIDIDASKIIEGEETIDEVGKHIYEEVSAVASGKRTKAEVLGHKELAIYWAWPFEKPKE